ncbi:unnamed protein product [Wuchereria bancrofti]|uniref:Uncharacterized protein n=1 Tax=Wuchereria bancrofti TaxID=6293 RepID=A0A3P7DKX5_WUCBA|nr:unnamed protein product [Wuchereria bancrofti]
MIHETTPKQNAKRIAERALRNVPWHLITYMHKNNIAAKPPIQINRSSVFHSSCLIPNRPSRYEEQLYRDKKKQNRIKCFTSTIPQKLKKYFTAIFRSQSLINDMDEKLSSISDHPSKYSSQRHPRRMLRRQLAIS